MVGRTHPLIEIEEQSSTDGIFNYTLLVGALDNGNASRRSEVFLKRLWGVGRVNVFVDNVETAPGADPDFGRFQDRMIAGPMQVFRVEATVSR